MKLSDLSQLDELMDEAEYNDFVKETEDEWFYVFGHGIPRTLHEIIKYTLYYIAHSLDHSNLFCFI
jgi:hypothetical protein